MSEGSRVPGAAGRGVVVRPGPSVVRDGGAVYATVRAERAGGRVVYRGRSLDDAVAAALAELESGETARLREREYFREHFSPGAVRRAERRLRSSK